jgi:excisionase family DNA binding protein
MGQTNSTAASPRWADQPARTVQEHRPPLSVRQGAAYLSVSQAKLWALISRGEIDSFKIDGSRRIMPSALDDYLAKQIAAARAERAAVAS